MNKPEETQLFRALETQALLAYREWPIWLVLREKALQAHLATTTPPPATTASTKGTAR